MTLRNVLLTLHIFFAIVIIGWLVMQSMVVPGMIRRGPSSAGFVRAAANFEKRIGPTSAIVFLIGIWLVLRDGHDGIEFSDGWVGAAMLLFIATAVIGAVFIGGAEERAAEKLEAGEPANAEAARISMLGGISTLFLLTIVYLMVAKPGGY
jgi:uncharacterized membrane protein